jgi:hypothetical protein
MNGTNDFEGLLAAMTHVAQTTVRATVVKKRLYLFGNKVSRAYVCVIKVE